jgi:molybdate transport system regulatory protein
MGRQEAVTNQPIEAAQSHKVVRTRTPAASAGDRKGGSGQSKDRTRLKIQIDFPGGVRLGPGKIALLEAIEAEGSLTRAAEKLHISYRRAWLFMQQINDAFDETAVATPEHGHGGGPARLTPFGREIIRHYRSMEEAAGRAGEQALAWLERHRGRLGDQ